MADGNHTTDDQPRHLREEVVRLRAENARLLADLERLAAGETRVGPGPAAADPLLAEPSPDGPRGAEGGPAAEAPEVAALTGQPIIAGAMNSASATTQLDCTGLGYALYVGSSSSGVGGVGVTGAGLYGFSYGQNGVLGVGWSTGLNGVQGLAASPGASGVYGQNNSGGYGVAGRSPNIGVFGESTGTGVYGSSGDGDGLSGQSTNGNAVWAQSVNGDAVHAVCHNQSGVNSASTNGYGVRGLSANSHGVLATTGSSTAAGLLAENDSGASEGVAVIALGQAGIGLYASGQQAAVQLGRSSLAGAPAMGFHNAGELVLDANADLYLCKASGSPGTWKLLG